MPLAGAAESQVMAKGEWRRRRTRHGQHPAVAHAVAEFAPRDGERWNHGSVLPQVEEIFERGLDAGAGRRLLAPSVRSRASTAARHARSSFAPRTALSSAVIPPGGQRRAAHRAAAAAPCHHGQRPPGRSRNAALCRTPQRRSQDGQRVDAVLAARPARARSDHDGDASRPRSRAAGEELARGGRVQAGGRFVEQTTPGLAEQRLREAQALAHALEYSRTGLAPHAPADALQQRGTGQRHPSGARRSAGSPAAEVVVQHQVLGR